MLFLERDRIAKVTPDDVLRVAQTYLKESNRTLGEFIPTKTPDRAVIPPTPDITASFKDFKGGYRYIGGRTIRSLTDQYREPFDAKQALEWREADPASSQENPRRHRHRHLHCAFRR